MDQYILELIETNLTDRNKSNLLRNLGVVLGEVDTRLEGEQEDFPTPVPMIPNDF